MTQKLRYSDGAIRARIDEATRRTARELGIDLADFIRGVLNHPSGQMEDLTDHEAAVACFLLAVAKKARSKE